MVWRRPRQRLAKQRMSSVRSLLIGDSFLLWPIPSEPLLLVRIARLAMRVLARNALQAKCRDSWLQADAKLWNRGGAHVSTLCRGHLIRWPCVPIRYTRRNTTMLYTQSICWREEVCVRRQGRVLPSLLKMLILSVCNWAWQGDLA